MTTKPDEIGHLTPAQELALDAFLTGATDAEAAKLAGVSRQCANGWRNHDSAFAAALNMARQELWTASQERLRAVTGKALEIIRETLDGSDQPARLSTALTIVKATGLLGTPLDAPYGPTDPEAVEAQWKRREMSRSVDRMMADL